MQSKIPATFKLIEFRFVMRMWAILEISLWILQNVEKGHYSLWIRESSHSSNLSQHFLHLRGTEMSGY